MDKVTNLKRRRRKFIKVKDVMLIFLLSTYFFKLLKCMNKIIYCDEHGLTLCHLDLIFWICKRGFKYNASHFGLKNNNSIK